MHALCSPAMAPAHPLFTEPEALLRQLFDVAVARAQPLLNMSACLPPPPHGRTVVVGAGKAAGAMAHALEALWPAQAPLSGVVVTRYHHTPPRPAGLTQRIEILEAAHPVPDQAGVDAAQRMMGLVQGLTPHDLVIALISGGGSALLTLPAQGLSLPDKQRINRALLESGANILEMNTVRKHLSRIKGGQLAAACFPAPACTLAISDVPGDDLAVIASGPTVPDDSTCAQALAILARYRIELPAALIAALRSGELETPKPGHAFFQGHQWRLLATPRQSLQAAAELARSMGLNAYVLSDEIEGESREVGKVHAALARAAAKGEGPFQKPCVLLSGGETTVTVRPQVDGRLIALLFRDGDVVKAGDVLARIDPTIYQAQYDQALAKKAQDEALLANAKRDLDRYANLARTEYATQQQADTQKTVVAQLTAQVAADQAAIDNAKAVLDYATIRAPISGRTGIRLVDEGNLLRAADATGLVTIAQIQPIALVFNLPQQQLRAVQQAMARGPVPVEARDADNVSVIDKGTLEVIDNQVDQTTGTVKLKARFDNAQQSLWPGQFVNVHMTVDTLKNVVTVPTAAIQRGPNGAFVYVVDAQSAATQKPVTLLRQTESVTAIAQG
ncbi:MAG: efflux RND transporter periplasmic adaptor subunit, partial [Betaproteobacteria bacterium]|nr:efflux RND transporter periplasmic adaptor subunit [Betaproteobacteria bacterium]